MALGWDSTIQNDGGDFKLLEPGVYPAVVKSFERSYFNGGGKIAACPMAIVTLRVNGETDTIERLMLDESLEWKLCQFFTALGMRRHGEALNLAKFDEIVGKPLWVEITHREYQKDGETRKANQIERFIDPADVAAKQAAMATVTATPAAPAQPAPAAPATQPATEAPGW